MSERIYFKVSEYAIKLIDKRISLNEFGELNSILASDPQAARHYNECMVALQYFRKDAGHILSEDRDLDDSEFDKALWGELSRIEKESPAIESKPEKPEREVIQKVVYQKVPHEFPTISLATALTTAAALLIMITYVMLNPKNVPEQVATISGVSDVMWSEATRSFELGTRLFTHQSPIELKKGVVEIEFDHGASVVIEGPAIFTIESHKAIYLSQGRAYTRVLEYGKGFTLCTPSSILVDIGTEFGVDVNTKGDSQLHVFKGAVILTPGKRESKGLKQYHYTAGQAVNVSNGSFDVRTIAIQRKFRNSVKEPEVPDSPSMAGVIVFEDFDGGSIGLTGTGWNGYTVPGSLWGGEMEPGLGQFAQIATSGKWSRLLAAPIDLTGDGVYYLAGLFKGTGNNGYSVIKFDDGVDNGPELTWRANGIWTGHFHSILLSDNGKKTPYYSETTYLGVIKISASSTDDDAGSIVMYDLTNGDTVPSAEPVVWQDSGVVTLPSSVDRIILEGNSSVNTSYDNIMVTTNWADIFAMLPQKNKQL